jgi:type II secretory pathway pseudopilin PulG
MGAAGKYWSFVMQREREEELLFRGGQYRQAIERYFLAKKPNAYPPNFEKLLLDDRFPQGKRHLRQQYLDPMTGEDFELVRDPAKGNGITGVFSKSSKEPFKKVDFAEVNKEFENKKSYNEWKFVFTPPQQAAPMRPGMPGVPPLQSGMQPIHPGAPSAWPGAPPVPQPGLK